MARPFFVPARRGRLDLGYTYATLAPIAVLAPVSGHPRAYPVSHRDLRSKRRSRWGNVFPSAAGNAVGNRWGQASPQILHTLPNSRNDTYHSFGMASFI